MRAQLDYLALGFRAPLCLALAIVLLAPPSASLALSPGDIAVIGYHGDGATSSSSSGDAFAWVPLVDLPAGEVIYFSDTGYYTSAIGTNNGFGGSGGGTDGVIQFTVPGGGIPFGQVQTIGNPINPTPSPYTQPNNAYINSTGSLVSSNINFSGSGDQIVAFQDNDLSDTNGFSPLYAVNGASSSWTSGVASDRNQTNLYPGLTNGTSAVAVGLGTGPQDSYDNARYVGSTVGTRSELLTEIGNPSNWAGTNGISETGNVFSWITNGVNQFSMTNQPPPIKILMIGNSYTEGTSTAPATADYLQGFFDADPDLNAQITVEAFGGASLFQHADVSSDAIAEIIGSPGEYDVVVLQERSDRPARAMKFGGSQLNGLNAGGPVLIDDYIKVHQPQAEVVLFNTWARHPDLEPANNDLLDDFFNNDPLEMQDFTNLGYQHIVDGSSQGDLSDITTIATVGDAWEAWYATYGYSQNSTLLHEPDGTHQTDNGAYLAAAVLFEAIANKSVIESSYTGDVTGNISGEALSTLLLQQAARFGSVPLPGDYNEDGNVDAADYTVWRDNVGAAAGSLPNDLDGGIIGPAQYLTWQSNFGNSISSMSAITVPEPSSGCLLIIGLLAMIYRQDS